MQDKTICDGVGMHSYSCLALQSAAMWLRALTTQQGQRVVCAAIAAAVHVLTVSYHRLGCRTSG